MTTIKCFEDLEIWKLSRVLVSHVYADFRECRDLNFVSQITSAALSIMNNCAEGFGRQSDKEFANFLNIAKGSTSEVKSMYYVAADLGYISKECMQDRIDEIQVILNSISRLKKYLRKE